MKKKLQILLVWTLISLFLQFGAYALLNYQIKKLVQPVDSEPISPELKVIIPGSGLTNIQISHDLDYLAYLENSSLKIYNLKKKKIVFEKPSPSETMGVLAYQWLPDRSTLIYFYAQKIPNKLEIFKKLNCIHLNFLVVMRILFPTIVSIKSLLAFLPAEKSKSW